MEGKYELCFWGRVGGGFFLGVIDFWGYMYSICFWVRGVIDFSFRLYGDGVIVVTGLLVGEGEVTGSELVLVGEGRSYFV